MRRRRKVWLVVFAVWGLWTAGPAGTAWAQFALVDPAPFLALPARVTVHDAFSPVGTDPAGAVVFNAEGQTLRVWGEILSRGHPGPGGSLGGFLATLNEPWRYDFYEVRGPKGDVRGHLLADPDVAEDFTLLADENLVVIEGEFMGAGAGEDG